LIDRCIGRLNRYSASRFQEEQKALQPLPADDFIDFTELTVKVTTSSTISVKRGLYTVPSRLIGETLRIHLYHDRLIGFVGQTQVLTLQRVYPQSANGRARQIDYRHVIHSLAAKPQAFRFLKFREELLPDATWRQLWHWVDQQLPQREACKWMVGVLRIAADHHCQDPLGCELLEQAQQHTLPDLKTLQDRYLDSKNSPDMTARQHDINEYDSLLEGAWTNATALGGQPCH